ncbi:uncharacterized protein LOC134209170 [Armigeres subalbatus]|uniref:uncharacterized protein LOC134209170 n=1 Tax=Armigeres subalbatus TaxID=124917 RepID=UPI002ED0D92E
MANRRNPRRNRALEESLQQSCLLCNLPDCNEMVCCGRCNQWFHFDCVGVNEDVANVSWSCPDCLPAPATNPAPQLPLSSIPPTANTERTLAEVEVINRLPADRRIQFLEQQEAIEQRYLLHIHRPVASSFVPRQRGYYSHASAFSHPHGNQHQQASTFVPLTGNLQPIGPEYYPSAFHNDPTATGGATLLNKSQIAARHAVPKELPVFTGEPEEWPLFFASFENSTHLCGFTPEENMVRLQKCLRGKALESVRCQLLHPSNLEQVLGTLKMLFGRPEIVVHSLLQKINNLPAPKADRLGTLVDFALAVRNMVATVKACELEEHLCNLTLLHSLTERLPPMIRLNWATHRQSLRVVTLSEFSDWLYKLAEAASAVTMPQFSTAIDSKSRRGRKDDGFLNAHTEVSPKARQLETNNGCLVCQGRCVAVEKCKRFISFGLSARWDTLREHKLCRSCLNNHRGPCKSAKPCGRNGYQYKHHWLLHNDGKDKLVQATAFPNKPSSKDHRMSSRAIRIEEEERPFYSNSGSSLTLMEDSLAEELNLNGEKYPLCLRWTADTCRYEKDAKIVSLNISGTHSGSSLHSLKEVYTVKELKLPSQSLPADNLCAKYVHLKSLPLESYSNVQPRIMIGVSNARVMHALDSREGNPDEPVAIKTRLGWTVYCTCPSACVSADSTAPLSFHICSHSHGPDETLHETVKNYFALDSLGIRAPQQSKEDDRALSILRDITTFQNGRYQVGLLWKFDDVRLPNNRSMALRRHYCLTKRMEREPQLAATLRAKMTDYVSKGYIRKLTPEECRVTGSRTWYLPIFPVFNPNKPGTVRIVFDAAATFGNVSLNSVLFKGPDQLNALPPVLYKFR